MLINNLIEYSSNYSKTAGKSMVLLKRWSNWF